MADLFSLSHRLRFGRRVYFYVLSLTDSQRRFERQDLLLFVPSALYVGFRLALFAQSLEFKDWFDEHFYVPFISPLVFVSEFIWNLFFLVLALKHYRKYRRWLDQNFSDTERIKFEWLQEFPLRFYVCFRARRNFRFYRQLYLQFVLRPIFLLSIDSRADYLLSGNRRLSAFGGNRTSI